MGMTMGTVDFGGITKEVCLACVPDAAIGEYVIVHAGFAISKVDEQEAEAIRFETREGGGLVQAQSQPNETFLEVPEEMTPRVKELATRWTSHVRGDLAKLSAIETRLKREYDYSLNFEREDGDGAGPALGQHAADDGAVLVLHQVDEVDRRVERAGFGHSGSLPIISSPGTRAGPPATPRASRRARSGAPRAGCHR